MNIEDFKQDRPIEIAKPEIISEDILINDVIITKLNGNSDKRGCLTELISFRENTQEPIVHVYKVEAESGSERGYVYHKWQDDRLAFTEGEFEIFLYDVRADSSTFRNHMKIKAGQDNKILLRIPKFVAHSVTNLGQKSSFINMPTNIYDPNSPDKFRINMNE
jgi:dTDP-4-dehydrorhamnose 3,5-epimerase